MSDLISRQAAKDALNKGLFKEEWDKALIKKMLEDLPSAEKRDIPLRPIEITDNTWGIPARQPVCPRCDYYLGRIVFLGDSRGKRITYCETCGQAIDWEGWLLNE